jgi:hypothetical protein
MVRIRISERGTGWQKSAPHPTRRRLVRDHDFWLYPRTNRRVPHISLVLREMWDTTGLPLKLFQAPQLRTGATCSHQRTWAENDERSPSTAFRSNPDLLH